MAHVLKCCYEIVRRLDILAGACHSYGNPIVQLLCEFFGYKLMIKDSMKDRDYVIYSLLKEKEHFVIAVIIDAKHCEKLNNSLIAQAMGYYCKAKQSNNQSGFAMLLNEFDEKIHAKFFLFPYKDKEDPEGKDSGYCIQSLMLPTLIFTYHEIVKEQGLIELILLLSDLNVDNPVVSLKCPPNVTPILPEHIIGVYTDMEYMQKEADEKAIKRAIKQAKKKFKRKLEKLEIQAEAKQKEKELREKLASNQR